ncbi:SLATT domain-containing protein [Olsenella uli]
MPGRSRYHLSTANLSSYEDRFRQLYWRIIWTHKIHEKQADIYSAERTWVDVLAMVLTAFSGCGILAANQLATSPFNVIPIAVAATAIFLDLKSHITDYGALITEQRTSAERFLSLREESLDLIAAAHDGVLDQDTACSALASLETEYERACSLSPRTTDRAAVQAERALGGGDAIASDEKIDQFLPDCLRRN